MTLSTKPIVRFAAPNDAEAIAAIYAPFVLDTAVTFECEAPSAEEFARRIETITLTHPFLVCRYAGSVAAYAYAARHRERAAYNYDVETSIYAAPGFRGRGIGRALYTCLLSLLRAMGYYNAYAGVVLPNEPSVRLHESLGFAPIGVYAKSGYKLGAWHDVVWLGKTLTEHSNPPGIVKTPGELEASRVGEIFEDAIALMR